MTTRWCGGFGGGALLALTCVVSACSGPSKTAPADAGALTDATSDATTAISSDAGYPACHEFAETAMPVPVQTTGDVSTAGADVLSPPSCNVVNAPYGIESSGVDQVIRVDDLVVGSDYTVVLNSVADLAFYVVTGCDTPTGPSVQECLLFEDDTSGHIEHGVFTAPTTSLWIVVDDYRTEPPSNGSFSLDVTAVQCHTSSDCSGATPACSAGQCVGCVTSFDCTSPAASVCDPHSNSCIEGPGGCAIDDPTENADDGPAGALVTAPDADSSSVIDGHLCNASDAEHDYIRFDVTVAGEDWSADLDWIGSQDLDLTITDAVGNDVGLSLYSQPEHIDLTYLPIGSYFIRIDDFSVSSSNSVPYQLTVTRMSTTGCTSTADCASTFINQIYRGTCASDGACVDIDGNGALDVGAPCDSSDDCATGEQCPAFFFVANADTRSVCAPNCVTDADCASAGSDYVCSTYLDANLCVQKCTDDDQCPRIPDAAPTTPPWAFLTCDLPSGQCLP